MNEIAHNMVCTNMIEANTRQSSEFYRQHWVHADAIMDRIVHNAVWVDMGEANMRQRRGADRQQ